MGLDGFMRYIVTFKARSANDRIVTRDANTRCCKNAAEGNCRRINRFFRGGKEEFGVFGQCIQGNAECFKNRFILLDTVTFKPFHRREQLIEFGFRLRSHVGIEHAAAFVACNRSIVFLEFPERIRKPIERKTRVVGSPSNLERLAAHLHFVFVVVFHKVRSSCPQV